MRLKAPRLCSVEPESMHFAMAASSKRLAFALAGSAHSFRCIADLAGNGLAERSCTLQEMARHKAVDRDGSLPSAPVMPTHGAPDSGRSNHLGSEQAN